MVFSNGRSFDFDPKDYPKMSDSEYFDFTKKIHAKLPREVRDLIYVHFSDFDTEFDIKGCARPSLIQYPETKGCNPRSKAPCFLNPSFTYKSVIQEIVEAFYRTCRSLRVPHPGQLDNFLREDFFGVGIAQKDSVLSQLSVGGSLDRDLGDYIWNREANPDNFLDPARLRNQFALISNGEQRLARFFRLNISFETLTDDSDSDRALGKLAEVLTEVFNELKPVFETVQARSCEDDVDVDVKIYFRDDTGPELWHAWLGAECAYFTEVQWMQTIKEAFGKP